MSMVIGRLEEIDDEIAELMGELRGDAPSMLKAEWASKLAQLWVERATVLNMAMEYGL